MSKEEIVERLEEIAKHAVYVLGEKPFFMSLDDGIAIHEAIDILKSAQPEIVRCKDCEWSSWYTTADGHRYCYCMETGKGGRTEDDFCSYAERREE